MAQAKTETRKSEPMEKLATAVSPKSKPANGNAAVGNHSEAMEKDLNDLFLLSLKDIYYAEKQILKTLPKMMKVAKNEELKSAFETHREQTAVQIERLEQVFQLLGKRAQAEQCEAMDGIIEEGKEVMDEFKGREGLDVGLVSAAKAVEHYEIARYSSLKMLANQLGLTEAQGLLEQNLAEELETDTILDRCGEALLTQAA